MAYSVQFSGASDGDDGPFQLCSSSGYQLLRDWVSGLSRARYRTLYDLVESGRAKDTRSLAIELKRGIPYAVDDDLRHTLTELQDLVGVGDRDEVIEVLS